MSKRDKKRYVKLRYANEKATCTMTPEEAASMMEDDPDLSGEDVWMTEAEFEALPEFIGW